jgi:hypothetical protein
MATSYTIAGESGTLYNGAQDTDGGIWVRIRDENDRRILGAAVDKQKKNQQASVGTLTALDPNAGHLTDYVGAALDRVLEAINGARPVAAQLDGTPMGRALAEENAGVGSGSGSGSGNGKGKRGKRGGAPSTVGEVLANVPGSPLAATDSGSDSDGGIQWAAHVPNPRPVPGNPIRTAQGHQTNVDKVIGFDGGANAFRVFDSAGWDGLVYHHAPSNEWRIMAQALDYPETLEGASEAAASEDDGDPVRQTEPAPEPTPEPDQPKRAAKKTVASAPTPQRERNAKATGTAKRERASEPRPAGKRSALPKKKK